MLNDKDGARQLRKCQECGHEQLTSLPVPVRGSDYGKWAELLCRKCKSPALDYGITLQSGEDSATLKANEEEEIEEEGYCDWCKKPSVDCTCDGGTG